jgi:hypothetical protein
MAWQDFGIDEKGCDERPVATEGLKDRSPSSAVRYRSANP